MGAVRRKPYPEIARERIDAAKLLKRLDEHTDGLIELKQTQIKAAEILLRKVIPDLKAIEHSGEIVTRYAEMSDEQLNGAIADALAKQRDPGKPGG